MHLELSSDSRVFVHLRAAGLLRAVAHDPTLSAPVERLSFDWPGAAGGDGPVDVSFVVRCPVAAIEPPSDLGRADREKMIANMRGAQVLDGARFPLVELYARYAGTLAAGALTGDLVVREVRRPITMAIALVRERQRLIARGAWEGRLTDLGIKPFRALLGAVKLDDWVRLRLEARFDIVPG